MAKHKVLLGDMPETLLRQNVGNTLEIQEARDLFKYVLSIVQQTHFPISIRKATLDFLPHVFQLPRDLFITAMLKETFQAAENVTAFVGLHHFNPINAYWKGNYPNPYPLRTARRHQLRRSHQNPQANQR